MIHRPPLRAVLIPPRRERWRHDRSEESLEYHLDDQQQQGPRNQHDPKGDHEESARCDSELFGRHLLTSVPDDQKNDQRGNRNQQEHSWTCGHVVLERRPPRHFCEGIGLVPVLAWWCEGRRHNPSDREGRTISYGAEPDPALLFFLSGIIHIVCHRPSAPLNALSVYPSLVNFGEPDRSRVQAVHRAGRVRHFISGQGAYFLILLVLIDLHVRICITGPAYQSCLFGYPDADVGIDRKDRHETVHRVNLTALSWVLHSLVQEPANRWLVRHIPARWRRVAPGSPR